MIGFVYSLLPPGAAPKDISRRLGDLVDSVLGSRIAISMGNKEWCSLRVGGVGLRANIEAMTPYDSMKDLKSYVEWKLELIKVQDEHHEFLENGGDEKGADCSALQDAAEKICECRRDRLLQLQLLQNRSFCLTDFQLQFQKFEAGIPHIGNLQGVECDDSLGAEAIVKWLEKTVNHWMALLANSEPPRGRGHY